MPVENTIECPIEPALSTSQQDQLRVILEKGLPKESRPYAIIGKRIGTTEKQVISQIKLWQKNGLIRRFGLVVKHRKLGFNANAMVVWDVPNELVDQVAEQLSNFNEVSLCYRRPRRLPDWPYNLFCMIHGTCRDIVLRQIEDITQQLQLSYPELIIEKDILFSHKAYKQHGARYGSHLALKADMKECHHG